MKEDDKEYIRAFAAMFAMNGLIVRGVPSDKVLEEAMDYATSLMIELDAYHDNLEAFGIAAIKPKKKYERKA